MDDQRSAEHTSPTPTPAPEPAGSTLPVSPVTPTRVRPGQSADPRRGPDYAGAYAPAADSTWNWGWSDGATTEQATVPPTGQPSYGYSAQGGWAAPAEPTTALTVPAVAPVKPARRRRSGLLVGAFVLSALVGAGTGVGSYALVTDATGGTVSPVRVSTVPAAQTPVLNGTVAAAVAKIQPSVVTITVQAGQSGDVGTGVVLDADGHVLTNYHVISAAVNGGTITVTLADGTTTKATVVGYSSPNDLAVIKVADTANLTPATFASSRELVDGQAVVAAGAPLGLSETYTSGIVSNTARPVRSGTDNDAVYLALQTDAAINPGNSGGPLVDLNGAVVGINSSIASTGSSQDQSGNIGIGFAIPSDVASRVAANLIADGASPIAAMGVTLGGTDQRTDTTSTGVALQTVTPDGAGAKAGLEAGDVVSKVNDFETTSADGLIAATRFYAPGTAVTVTYVRDGGSARTATVTLGSL